MGKLIAVFEATESDPDGKDLLAALQERFPMERVVVHPVYRDAYDVDYNMTKFLCLPPVGDPQPLKNEDYLFKIGIVTDPDTFDKIKHQVELMSGELSVDYLSYESHGKDTVDG